MGLPLFSVHSQALPSYFYFGRKSFWSGVLPASLGLVGGRDTYLKLTDSLVSFLCVLPDCSCSHVSPARVSSRYGADGSLACSLVSPVL